MWYNQAAQARGVRAADQTGDDMARSKGPRIALLIVLALVVAIGVTGVALAMSTSSIMGKMDQIQTASDRLQAEASSFDLEASATTIEEISSLWNDVEQETNAWQWQVARWVPVFGEDVSSLQSAAGIAKRLSGEAVSPVVEQLRELGGGFDGDIFSIISSKITQLGDLVAVLSDARIVVSECRTDADALPTAHLTQVNEVIETLKQEVGSIDDTLGIFDALSDSQGGGPDSGATGSGTSGMGEATAA